MEVIFISGIFMSFFIVFLLLTKRNKVLTDRILAAWVAIMGIHLLGYYLNQQGYWEKYRKSGLKPEIAAGVHQKLVKHIEEERPLAESQALII